MVSLKTVGRGTSIGRKVDSRDHVGKPASRAKAASSTNAFRKLLDHEDLGCVDLARVSHVHQAGDNFTSYSFNDQLGNSVALVDSEVGLAKVKEQNLERAAVVSVNDTGTDVDRVFRSKSGARSYSAVCISCQWSCRDRQQGTRTYTCRQVQRLKCQCRRAPFLWQAQWCSLMHRDHSRQQTHCHGWERVLSPRGA